MPLRCCRWCGLFLLPVLALSGCGGKYKPVPVEGIVTLDGQPVPGATVLFVPEDAGGRSASAMSDSEGNFQLTTYHEGDGALAGKYRVVVTKTEAIQAPPAQIQPGDGKSVIEHYRNLKSRRNRKPQLPAVYASEDTTNLRCTVPHGGTVTLDLSSKPAK
jgi:hypothetical protein